MNALKQVVAAVALGTAVGSAAFAQADGSLQWSFVTQNLVYSSPAVGTDGTVYVGSESRRLWAINADGTLKWRWPSTLLVSLEYDWFDASPAVGSDGTIYIGNFNGTLYAINANGSLKWEYDTASYILSSVAIAPDGTLYFGAGDGSLHAVNPNGTEKWIFATGDWVDSSPAVGSDGTIYFGSWDGFIYAVNPDGTQKWAVATGDAILSSPALGADDTVYIGSADGFLYAVQPNGTVAWTFATGDAIDASPVVGPDGRIYCGSADGYFYALLPDGSPAWPQPFDVGQGVFGGALIRSDGSILFGAGDRHVYALNANGTLKWNFATGDVVDSAPAVGPDGTIYVGSADQKLYALNGNGSTVAASSWPKYRNDDRNQGRGDGSGLSAPPTIAAQPQAQMVAFGESVTFSVAVGGTAPFSFQWEKDGVAIAGATGSSYIIELASSAEAGSYRVRITNDFGEVLSASVTLEVGAPIAPTITAQPRSLVLIPGKRLSLWVLTAGSPPLSYQWSKDGVEIPGATGAFYEVAVASAADGGGYTVEVSNPGGTVTSTAATVSLNASATSQLVNLSTRGFVGTGGSILIPGLYIVGADPRTLLIRAVGPTLGSKLGVPDVLADPMLTIYSGQTAIHSNDNWGDAPNAAEIVPASASVYAFSLPAGSADAVALVDLNPGGYTVHVAGVGGTTGTALVEVYDITGAGVGSSRLVNISTRAQALTGSNTLIPGFSVVGDGAATLLIRAVGPTISEAPFNVPDVLADPTIEIYQGQSLILTVDDWGDVADPAAMIAAFTATGAFKLEAESADAAVQVVLMPGSYTVHAKGVGGSTGNVLVDVYEVP